jgi:hypothetical protein
MGALACPRSIDGLLDKSVVVVSIAGEQIARRVLLHSGPDRLVVLSFVRKALLMAGLILRSTRFRRNTLSL